MKKLKKFSKEYGLTPEAIDEASMELSGLMEENGFESPTVIRVRLSVETELIELMESLGEGHSFKVEFYKKFRQYHIALSIAGENVIADKTETAGNLEHELNYLRNQLDTVTEYSYANGSNHIDISVPRASMGYTALMILAILLAVATYLVTFLLPDGTGTLFAENVLDPVTSLIFSLLSMTAMVLIFTSTASSICSMSSISELNQYASGILKGIMKANFASACIPVIVLGIALGVIRLDTEFIGNDLREIAALFTGIFPSNVVEPFITPNPLQILFLGAFFGCVALSLGKQVPLVTEFIKQLNTVILKCVMIVCRFMPIAIYTEIASVLIQGGFKEYLSSLPILLLHLAGVLITIASVFVYIHIRYGVSVARQLRCSLPVGFKGLVTCSSLACLENIRAVCRDEYKVEPRRLELAIPLEMVSFKISFIIVFTIFPMAYGYFLGNTFGLYDVISLIIMGFLFSIAAPPVSGSDLIIATILFKSMGLPADSALALYIALYYFLDMMVTSTQVLLTPNIIMAIDRKARKIRGDIK